jgi:hypothetical protein
VPRCPDIVVVQELLDPPPCASRGAADQERVCLEHEGVVNARVAETGAERRIEVVDMFELREVTGSRLVRGRFESSEGTCIGF